jgi:hypothetical protein
MIKVKFFIIIFTILSFSTIYSQSIVTYKNNDLTFGDVFIGYNETIQTTDERAAKFYFYHTKIFMADLLVTFKLPNYLSNGIDKLPISFISNSGAWAYFDRQSGRTNFNPKSPLEIRRAFFYLPIYLWLGGTISTNSSLSPGIYNGSITLTIEFL